MQDWKNKIANFQNFFVKTIDIVISQEYNYSKLKINLNNDVQCLSDFNGPAVIERFFVPIIIFQAR